MRNTRRWIATIATTIALATGGTAVLPPVAAAPTTGAAGDRPVALRAGTVRIDTPVAVRIVEGCHERWLARLTFDMPAGGNYDVVLGGWDADGYSFNGSASARGVAGGPTTVTLTSQICGYRRTPGRATLRIFVTIGTATEPVTMTGDFTAYTHLKNRTSVPLREVTRVQRRGAWVALTGVRAVRGRFPDSKYLAPLRYAPVRVYHRPVGGAWRYVGAARTDGSGVWRKRFQVRRTGDWQVRYAGTPTLMPASSPVRRIRVR